MNGKMSLSLSVWEVSLLVLCGLINCLSMIRMFVAQGSTWIHEWSSRHLHTLFSIITLREL